MECDTCRNKLLEYLDRDLAGDVRTELEAHLTECAGCREELQSLQETLALVARMPAPEPSETFWQQYLRELRQNVATPTWSSRIRDWFASLTVRPIPAMATAIALVVAVFLTWNIFTEQATPPTASLVLTEQLALSQDLELLRDMELLEALELLEDWDVIESTSDRPRAA